EEGDSWLRARLRSATCASADASRANASLSTRRSNGSPANTRSLACTSTSPITPMSGAATLNSPDAGSTRPGATACQRFSSVTSARAAREASSAPMRDTNTAEAAVRPPTHTTSNTAILNLRIIVNPIFRLASLVHPRVASFLANDASVFDANHPIGERQYTGVVGDHQYAALGIVRDLGQELHDGVAVLAVERRGRLVGEDGRRVAHDRARDRHTLLLATRELAWERAGLVPEPDPRQRLLAFDDRACRVLAAHVERQADVVGGGKRGEQMIGLEDEADLLAPQLGEVLRALARGRLAT